MTEQRYALIDGAMENELLAMLQELDPPVSCLYAEPVQDELVELAPYLVLVTDEVQQWLKTRHHAWGYYITTAASMKDIRQHLRKYLQVMIEGEKKPVFFRFYDPRNIWALCELLTDWQLHQFLGPITALTTDIDNVIVSDDFKSRRESFPRDVMFRKKMLTFSMGQMHQLTGHLEKTYIEKLAGLMETKWYPQKPCNYSQFAHDIFYYLQSLDITDDRTVQGFCQACFTQGYDAFEKIPQAMKSQLESPTYSSQINADLLIGSILGSVPPLNE